MSPITLVGKRGLLSFIPPTLTDLQPSDEKKGLQSQRGKSVDSLSKSSQGQSEVAGKEF